MSTTGQWYAATQRDVPAPRLMAREPDGAELRAAGDGVTRTTGGATVSLDCTEPAGPGSVRAVVAGPHGMSFVAAARGVFLLHPTVAVLDRLELGDGVPLGAPVDLLCDRDDRLWWLTEDALACVHIGQWFGVTHGAADGLPPPPYRAIARDGDLLRLWHGGGVHERRLVPQRPELGAVAVRGAVAGDGRFELACAVAPHATIRWRSATHHRLRPLREGALQLGYPGRHELRVCAFDRELDVSAEQSVGVIVPYPRTSQALLFTIATVALGIVVAVSWTSRQTMSAGRALLHGLLTAAVLLQVIGAGAGHGRTYPCIGFSMYREVYRQDQVLYTPEFLVRSVDGDWQPAMAGPLSFTTDGTWRHVAENLFAEPAVRSRLVAERLGALGALGIELRVRRCRLTAAGPREVAPWVLGRFLVDGSGR